MNSQKSQRQTHVHAKMQNWQILLIEKCDLTALQTLTTYAQCAPYNKFIIFVKRIVVEISWARLSLFFCRTCQTGFSLCNRLSVSFAFVQNLICLNTICRCLIRNVDPIEPNSDGHGKVAVPSHLVDAAKCEVRFYFFWIIEHKISNVQ